LNSLVNDGDEIILSAVDGSIIEDVYEQDISAKSDFVFLSVSGNDGISDLQSKYLTSELENKLNSDELENYLSELASNLKEKYEKLVQHILSINKSLILCTIYSVIFDDPIIKQVVDKGLFLLNQNILDIGSKYNLKVLRFDELINKKEDFTQTIEPSEKGGKIIAQEIFNNID